MEGVGRVENRAATDAGALPEPQRVAGPEARRAYKGEEVLAGKGGKRRSEKAIGRRGGKGEKGHNYNKAIQ